MPLFSRRSGPAACAVVIFAAAIGLACSDSTTTPGQKPLTIALGDSVDSMVSTGDTLVYRMTLDSGTSFTVHLRARDGAIVAGVFDPSGNPVANASANGGANALGQWTLATAATAGTYKVELTPANGSAGGRFALHPVAVTVTPDEIPPTIQLGDTVSGESIDNSDDVDDFVFDATAGQEVEIFLQELAQPVGPGMIATAPDAWLFFDGAGGPTTAPIVSVAPASPSQDLEQLAPGRIKLTSAGRYRLRISNPRFTTALGYVGAYRFMVYPIDRSPETAPATLTPGDTIAERIDHVGDVDVFTLSATSGRQFNLFAEAGGASPRRVIASVYAADSSTAGARATINAEPGQQLLDVASGRFTMPAEGLVKVVVSDASDQFGLFRGPYRLFVYPIDSAPESRPAEFVPSANAIADAIDQLGDIDVFHFTVDSAQELVIRTSAPTDYGTLLQLQVVNDATGPLQIWSSVPAGSYHVTAQSIGIGQAGGFRGPYAFAIAPVFPAPEIVAPSLSVGDTVAAETLGWPRDIDTLHLTSPTADTVVFELSRPAGDTAWSREIYVFDPSSNSVLDLPSIWDPDRYQLPRLDLKAGATLRVGIVGGTSAWAPGTSASYTLVARRVSAAPEHRSPNFVLGDTVRDSLDYYGDIDDYVVSGTPGEYVDVQGAWPIGYSPPKFVVSLIDPATDSVLAYSGTIAGSYSEPTKFPASGVLRVRACVGDTTCARPTCSGWACSAGPHPLVAYWLLVRQINRAPETVPATFAFGDTVSGESIDRINDIDEFTFAGAAGQQVNVAFQWTEQVSPLSGAPGLQLELIDASTGNVLATLLSNATKPSLDDVASGPVVLPSTGGYVLRVRPAPDPTGSGTATTGPFRFRVTNAP